MSEFISPRWLFEITDDGDDKNINVYLLDSDNGNVLGATYLPKECFAAEDQDKLVPGAQFWHFIGDGDITTCFEFIDFGVWTQEQVDSILARAKKRHEQFKGLIE